MMTTPRRRDELDRAIDAAAGEMAAAILGPSRKSADTSEFLHALRVYTRRSLHRHFRGRTLWQSVASSLSGLVTACPQNFMCGFRATLRTQLITGWSMRCAWP